MASIQHPATNSLPKTARSRPSRSIHAAVCAAMLALHFSSVAAPLPSRVQTNAPPQAARMARTNALPARAPVLPGPNKAPARTNAVASTNAPAASGTNFWSSLNEKFQSYRSNPMFFTYLAVAVCGILGLMLAINTWLRRRKTAAAASSTTTMAKSARKSQANVRTCNVLQATEDSRKLWSFDARGRGFSLNREFAGSPGQALPQGVVSRDWRDLFQKKLNIAWLPPEHVFLKVIHLPRSSFEETLAMVELQVEKLSPMPVAQVVWSIQILPQSNGELDTIVVMIVSRAIVEDLLGRLENEGYLADRLELPLLDQLQATPVKENGAYIYPGPVVGKDAALIAWWYDGVLRNLDLANLPAQDRVEGLREQLSQMTWAGELEGWLTSTPRWFLIADEGLAAEWEPALREALEQPVEVLAPLPIHELAVRTAARAAKSETGSGLMPAEVAARYHQQFVDRLWMRGLGAVVALYLIGVAIYMVALNVASYRTRSVEKEVAGLSMQYTNALQLKAQSQILKDRMDLRFAALDSWATISKLLPEGVTLDSLNFRDGKVLTITGTAPADKTAALTDFEDAMRKATVNGQPLFDPTRVDNISYQGSGASVVWSLKAELKRSEAQ